MKKVNQETNSQPAVGTSGESLFWWGALVIGLVAMVIHNYRIMPWMLDDAFISFRYSENFASGNGLVFNLGERVEGYTTFLWVFLLGVGNWLGMETVSIARVLAWLAALATIGLVAVSYRIISGVTRFVSGLAVLLLCSCGVFSPWPSSGMEVSLFGLLILLTIQVYATDKYLRPSVRFATAGILAALVVMTRPEGILLVGLIGLHAMYRILRNREREASCLLATFLIFYGAFFAWRYSYYGYLLPNTFYAKVGSSAAQLVRGSEYLGEMAIVVWPLFLLAAIAVWKGLLKRSVFFLLGGAYLVLHIVYIWLVGGDCMPAFRFLAPVVPLLALAAAIGIESLRTRKAFVSAIIVLVVGFNLYQMMFAFPITGHIQADKVAIRGKEVGLWLKENLPPGSLVATNTAGTIPYYSGLPVVDMLGLNDVTIAHRKVAEMGSGLAGHEKGDGRYVLGRNPAVIQFHSSIGRLEPSFLSDRELVELPEFHRLYQPVSIYIPSLAERAVLYVRNDIRLPGE